jgi:uncharacterized protein YabN with tetrapyrrole methylase and pyrophosphatase domain
MFKYVDVKKISEISTCYQEIAKSDKKNQRNFTRIAKALSNFVQIIKSISKQVNSLSEKFDYDLLEEKYPELKNLAQE